MNSTPPFSPFPTASGSSRHGSPGTHQIEDEELDRWILTRLAMVGVDLGVLPEDDPDAPADQRRVLVSLRQILRERMPVVSDYPLDPMQFPPVLYPAHLPEVREATVVRADEGDTLGEGP